jgi:prophage DNA circulation protein
MLVLTVGRRRYIGLALVAYGLAGLLLLAVAGAVIGGTNQQLSVVGATVGEQRDALVGTLRATSLAMRNASSGVGNVGQSLTAAHASADHAAGLARSLGTTLHGLSAAMGVQIFGTQPLAALASGFDNAAGQSDELAADLDNVGSALTQNTTDLETSRKDLAALSDRVDLLAVSVATTPFGVSQEPGIVELVLIALLIWLAVPAVASIAVGVALLRTVAA